LPLLADEYFINEAQARYLLRLRKDRLVRLYQAAGLADDPELLTKPEIVDAIIAARDDLVSLPPSSPPGRNGNDSSDYSSDDGGTVGDESPDRDDRANALRRRETVNDLGRALNRVPKGRSLSMGQISTHIASSSRRTPRTPIDSPVETNLRQVFSRVFPLFIY
jgi:mitogen-activated protein kinase kinase kinase 13